MASGLCLINELLGVCIAFFFGPASVRDDQLFQIQSLIAQSRFEAAFEICAQAISKDLSDWNAIYLAGITLRLRGDFVGAIDYYRRALDLNSDSAPIWGALGIALQSLRRFPEAIDALSTAINLDNDNYAAHNSLGLTHKLAGDYILAMSAYEDTLQMCANRSLRKVRQDHPDLFPVKQKGKFRVQSVNRACIKFTRQILATDSEYFNTIKNMVTCCIEMGNQEMAQTLEEHAKTCTPFERHLIGLFYLNTKQP